MLKRLRHKKTAKKIWITLAIIIVPAFVLWGFGGAFRSREESGYAGKIFSKKVSLLEFKDSMGAVRNQAIMQFGENFDEIKKYLNLESQAWERLILLHEANKRKIKVSDKEVIGLIESYPFFKRKGQFDNRLYNETLQYVFRTQPRIFEEQTRENLMLSKLYKQITDSIKVDDKEAKDEYQRLNTEISVFYIGAIPSDFTKNLNFSESQIKDYFSKNTLQFKQPISFNLDYLVSESEDKIKEAVKRLDKKADFNKVATGLGLEVKETGLFSQTDPIPGIGWSAEILNLIQQLKVNEISKPFQLDKNYYILKLKETKESFIPDFGKIKDKVKETLIKTESEKIAKEKIEQCLSRLKESSQANPKSADFNKAAKEFGLKSDSTLNFKYNSYIEGIGGSDVFWDAAQALKEDLFSDVLSLPSGFYIIKLKSKSQMEEKKFAEQKADIIQKISFQKKQERFSQFLEELKTKAK